MSLKFDLLEKFRRALFRSDGVPDGVRNAAEADYLVKMNIPPLLGRRDAACEYLQEILRPEVKDMELRPRLNLYRKMLEILEYAIVDTESVAMTLASAETAGREHRIHTFLATLRDLLSAACALAEAGSAFSEDDSELGYFLGKAGKLARYQASGYDSEMRALNLALDLSVAAAAKFAVYRDYNRKSFSSTNSARYKESFEVYTIGYRKGGEAALAKG